MCALVCKGSISKRIFIIIEFGCRQTNSKLDEWTSSMTSRNRYGRSNKQLYQIVGDYSARRALFTRLPSINRAAE